MAHVAQVLVLGIAVVLVAQFVWRKWHTAQLSAKRKLASLQFADVREELQKVFLSAASATGKPRGLSWKQCDLSAGQLFAVDRANGELYAFVGATISFEAIPGGDMEDVEAVGNLRSATATFVHRGGQWTTDGRVVFNLEPQQALEHYQESLQAFD